MSFVHRDEILSVGASILKAEEQASSDDNYGAHTFGNEKVDRWVVVGGRQWVQ